MHRYFIEVMYKGTNYSGLQTQTNATTIQSVIENAFQKILRQTIHLTGSSRTDAGVHALQNFFHIDTEDKFPIQKIYNINAILPTDIVVKNIYAVPPQTHCRFNALSRQYKYFIATQKNPFIQDRSYYYPYTINLTLLQQAAAIIQTQNNFINFSKKHTQVNNFICDIQKSQWNTTSSLTHQPYSYSKVSAEKAAWEMANAQHQWKLVVINPTFVMGPVLTSASDSESIKLIKDYLTGKFITGVPELRFGIVDVRDVAKAHILAAQNASAEGRHIINNLTLTMLEIGNLIKKVSGKSFGLPFMTAPKWLMASIGFLFGVTKDFVNKNAGYPLVFDNSKSKTALKLTYRNVEDTMKDMIDSMKKQGIV